MGSSITMLSDTARLILRLTRSKLENMTQTQSMMRKSNCITTNDQPPLSTLSNTNHKSERKAALRHY